MEEKYKSKIRAAREKAGLSRAEMSRRFEIPIRTLENWEAGSRIPPAWAEKLIIKELESMEVNEEMTEERLAEIKQLYIELYPHLKTIKVERQFWVNAARLCVPDEVKVQEFSQILTIFRL